MVAIPKSLIKISSLLPRSIFHHQKRCIVMQTEVQHTYDMWMVQASDSLSFSDKASHIVIGNLGMQNLDSSLHLEIYMLAKINIGETSLAKQTNETIVTELLSYAIIHNFASRSSERSFPAMRPPDQVYFNISILE